MEPTLVILAAGMGSRLGMLYNELHARPPEKLTDSITSG